ncbi:MAG: DUF2269 domain-containing protein, partial [Rhodocyclaceae bacterium]|nr:DUF2269 domain-containing protein [Rhodocyclaceae bacterium]
ADWTFTTPTVVFQPISGAAMAHMAGIPLTTPWLLLSLGLYLLAGSCWLPVVCLQIRMQNMAAAALAAGTPLPAAYWQLARFWFWLGVPAFTCMVLVVALMVFKHIPGSAA